MSRARRDRPLLCAWQEHDPWGPMPLSWDTECGETWSMVEGGLEENKVSFCPHCGGSIIEKKYND